MTELEIVAENLRRLFAHAKHQRPSWPKSFKKLAFASGLDRETVSRTIKAKTATGIDNLGKMAAPFGLEAWQLLVRGLDPARPPRVLMTELLHAKGPAKLRTTGPRDPVANTTGSKTHNAAPKPPGKKTAKRSPRASKAA